MYIREVVVLIGVDRHLDLAARPILARDRRRLAVVPLPLVMPRRAEDLTRHEVQLRRR
jgi:hypothetical protein